MWSQCIIGKDRETINQTLSALGWRTAGRASWCKPDGTEVRYLHFAEQIAAVTSALSLNQLFSARPMLGYADYRGPIRELYHCGSGAHPGGGVTGAPDHNAAKAILSDLRPSFLHLQ